MLVPAEDVYGSMEVGPSSRFVPTLNEVIGSELPANARRSLNLAALDTTMWCSALRDR
jgi:hypothetical protein